VNEPTPTTAIQKPTGEDPPQTQCRMRILFDKGDEVKYISHLDLLRAWERAIRRSRLPLAYSMGFSPHPKITIALPLAVGCTAENEALDIVLTEPVSSENVIRALASVMPPGLAVRSAQEVALKHPAMVTLFDRAVYEILLVDIEEENVARRIQETLDQESIPVEFRRKKFDLRPLIGSLTLGEVDGAVAARYAGVHRPLVLEAVLLRDERGRIGRPDVLLQALELVEHARHIHRAQVVYRTPSC
jgi:radical SAM-linked protein